MIAPLQKQLSIFWNKQNRSQRVVIIALALALVILVPVLVTWSSTPSYAVAYSGLSEEDAGQIVQKLEENNIAYQLKNTGTILVENDKVYDTRLRMAREGLPQSSTAGYELFSGNTLGMTEFTQKITYQRALEGELQRTIENLEAVESARVHVVTPEKSLLVSDDKPATASITIKESSGQVLDKAQVRAITHLVASSVEGLTPENVVVVDNEGHLLASGGDGGLDMVSSQSDSQRMAETSAAEEIRRKVQIMLDNTLGPNKAMVQASVAMDWTARETTSNTYDPTPSAVRSSQKINETYNTDGITTGGVPGADSNLPTPVPTVTGMPAGTIYSRSEETLNYEISQVQSKEVITPGQISRVSISVMVDNITDQQQIENIKTAVVAAAGINESRGDMVVVNSLAFDRSYYESEQAALEEQEQTNLYIQYGMIGAAALVLIIMFALFMRSIRNLRKASREAWRPIMQPVGQLALQSAAASGPMLPGMTPMQIEGPNAMPESQGFPAGNAGLSTAFGMAQAAQQQPVDVMAELNAKYSSQQSAEDEQRAMLLTKLAEESPATVAEIIQVWLNSDDNRNG